MTKYKTEMLIITNIAIRRHSKESVTSYTLQIRVEKFLVNAIILYIVKEIEI